MANDRNLFKRYFTPKLRSHLRLLAPFAIMPKMSLHDHNLSLSMLSVSVDSILT